MRLGRLTRGTCTLVVWLAVCAGASAWPAQSAWALAAPQAAEPAPGWHAIPLPAPIDTIAAAADLPTPAAPEVFLFDLIRAVHERPPDAPRAPTGPLAGVLAVLGQSRAAEGAVVPLPLAPETWARVVFGRPIPPEELAAAILADRRASLLYVGLGALDEETLAFVGRNEALVAQLAQHAAVLAAFGRCLSIREGSVRLGMPDEYRASWESLVGVPASDPARFIPALLGRDHGRLAYFLDAIGQLDEPRQRFVLGTGTATRPADRANALLAAYEPIRRAYPEWWADVHPFYRPPFDLVRALRAIHVGDAGALRPPASRALWERVFATWVKPVQSAVTGQDARDVDAPWLLEHWLGSSVRDASLKLEQMRIAQRLFADRVRDASSLERALDGVGRYPALALMLERLDVTDPAVHAAAADAAGAATSRASGRDGFAALSLFQGMLALIERACWAGTIDQHRAAQLLHALLERPPSSGGDYEGALVDWLSETLLPAFGAVTGVAPGAQPERAVLSALAGIRRDSDGAQPAFVDWEGGSYRLDVAAGAMDRLLRFRAKVATPSLDQALLLHRTTQDLRRSAAPDIARLSGVLDAMDGLLPVGRDDANVRSTFDRVRRAVSRMPRDGRARRPGDGLVRDLLRLRNQVAADAIRALVYLPSLGDPEGPARLGADVARRHRFNAPDAAGVASPAWLLPREYVTVSEGWHVRGALLGLDVGLARLALRRLDLDRIPLDPRIDDSTKRRFAVAAALAHAGDVSDTLRDRVAAALTRGRARVTAAARDPDAIAAVVSAAGLDARRRQALKWAMPVLSFDPVTRLSLGEIMRLGSDEPLSVALETIPDVTCLAGVAACGARLSDVALRMIDALAARRLPAALLPGVLAPATQDLLDDVQWMHADDEQAIWQWVRDVRPERIDDYVAALAGAGPLVAVEAKRLTGERQ